MTTVIDRHGKIHEFDFGKITSRIKGLLSEDEQKKVNLVEIVRKTAESIFPNITTQELDLTSANVCATFVSSNPLYGILGGRILASNLRKCQELSNLKTFSQRMQYIADNTDKYLKEDFNQYIQKNATKLDKMIVKARDYDIDYFGFKTLERSYLMKIKGKIVETPQDLFMRVAVNIHYRTRKDLNKTEVLDNIKNTYDLMSQKYFIHATPTLFNSGTTFEQSSSCFLLGTDDSLEGIFKTITDCAKISKWAGGIGVHVSNIRAKGARIHSTNGESTGIVPMLKVYNDVARYVNQCFVPDTIIFTKDGCKEIQNIQINDMVLTSDGTFKPVLQVIKNEVIDEDIYLIKHDTIETPLQCTGAHEIAVIRSAFNIEFLPAKELKTTDYMVYPPCFTYKLDTEMANIKKHTSFTKDYSYYARVVDIQTKKYTGSVYDLTIQDNHNYTTFAGLVHNSGRRPGSIAVYLEPWHADVIEFLELKLNTGAEELRARDLFLAMWVPDLFMKQVESNGDWYLMSPDACPGLQDVYGEEFETLYWKYVEENKYVKKIPASKVWEKILVSQIETGVPYIVFKDNVNRRSNQSNVGVVKSSNLCVAPETQVLTDKGYVTIKDYENQTVNVWNGKEFSTVTVKSTSPNNKLIKVSFSNGSILECTPYHMFYIKNADDNRCNYDKNKSDIKIPANHLRVGDIISSFKLPNEETIHDNVTVISVDLDNGNRCDATYCFTEPLEHKGVFNGILTGQCAEITEVSTHDSYAVCNLASICVNRFLRDDGVYDWELLHKVARTATYNLNQIIDNNYYPTPETKENNLANRPIGIGIQGLADLLCKMKLPFESQEAINMDADIMETIYHGAVEMSIEQAEKYGPYPNFAGSPMSKGLFQFDLAGITPRRYDWSGLKERVKKGIRNSLLTALMPTASTSQIQGHTECFEPVTSNIYTRNTLAGNFMIVNKYLIDELKTNNLWDLDMKNDIIDARGSIQNIDRIPQSIKDVYKTAWEIKQKAVIDHAIARGAYVDQSQSMNVFFATPTYDKITSALFYGWKNGLKTGCYYLRSLPAIQPLQFSQDVKKKSEKKDEKMFCSLANPEACVMCSS
jgi:ribonucleotide reductase alpha subunit